MAIKVAGATRRIKIITSVVQLPLHDMRTYAGEVVLAELFTDGRLILGVGRGAFAVEMDRMGAPIEESREKFDESLNVLQACWAENVSWSGKYYNFDELTVMPGLCAGATDDGRPVPAGDLPLHPARVSYPDDAPDGHERENARADRRILQGQGRAWRCRQASDHQPVTGALAGKDEATSAPSWNWRTTIMRGSTMCSPDRARLKAGRSRGCRTQTLEELRRIFDLHADEFIDQLAVYEEAGVDELILSQNIGTPNQETLDNMQSIAEEVMPRFSKLGKIEAG